MSDILLQQKMRKRLVYAMPRVPLQRLKQRNEEIKEEDTAEPAETMVGAMAKRMKEAHKARKMNPTEKKQPLGGDIEHEDSDKSESDENHIDDTQGPGLKVEGAAANERPDHSGLEMMDTKAQHISVGDQHLDIDKEEIDIMRTLLAKIEKKNKGLNLKLVAVQSGKEIDLGEEDERIQQDEEIQDQAEITRCDEVVVQALVHQAESGEHGRNDDFQDHLAENNNAAAELGAFAIELNPAGGAKPKQIARGHQNQNARGRQISHKNTANSKTQDTTQISWGLDESSESSESDGGWDMDGGDIPLVPR